MQKKGFTLIEILVSLTVFSLMSVVISSVFYSVYLNWKKQRDLNRNFQEARWAMEFMSNEIRHANSSCLSSAADHVYFSQGGQCSGGGSWDGLCYYFDSAAHTLSRCKGSKEATCSDACNSSQETLATSVADADFTVEEGDMANITLTLRPKPAENEGVGNRNITLTTKARARN